MRTTIPHNEVSHPYGKVVDEFLSMLKKRQGKNLRCVFLSGSYARGEATEASDLDVFCIFGQISLDVLADVGFCARNTSVPYDSLEINAQCFGMNELQSHDFDGWTETPVKILDSVLLYGKDFFKEEVSVPELRKIYTKYLVDVLMSIRHYLCVDEPVEKLTYRKIQNNLLKPLMFPLRMERYCATGVFPLTLDELERALDGDEKLVVALYRDETLYNKRMKEDHRAVLGFLHALVCKKLSCV